MSNIKPEKLRNDFERAVYPIAKKAGFTTIEEYWVMYESLKTFLNLDNKQVEELKNKLKELK